MLAALCVGARVEASASPERAAWWRGHINYQL
jgi:hypothetical protein